MPPFQGGGGGSLRTPGFHPGLSLFTPSGLYLGSRGGSPASLVEATATEVADAGEVALRFRLRGATS